MATKQQIRKYIHKIKSCNRIEVFYDRTCPESTVRWFHYISRKGEFLGFSCEIPDGLTTDEIVNASKKYMTGKYKLSDVGDNSIYVVRKYHVRDNKPDGVIVRKNSKWTWIK